MTKQHDESAAPAFALDDFVEILAGPAKGELGCIATVTADGRFGVRNMAGHRGHYAATDLKSMEDK